MWIGSAFHAPEKFRETVFWHVGIAAFYCERGDRRSHAQLLATTTQTIQSIPNLVHGEFVGNEINQGPVAEHLGRTELLSHYVPTAVSNVRGSPSTIDHTRDVEAPRIYLQRLRIDLHPGLYNEFRTMVNFNTLSDFPKTVLRPDFCEVDDFRRQILWYLSFVELTGDDLTELGRNHAWMRVFFTRDVDAEYIGILRADIVCFLEMTRNRGLLTIILRKNKLPSTFNEATDSFCPCSARRWDGDADIAEKLLKVPEFRVT